MTKVMGMSPRWMPIEYLFDTQVSEKTDIWSLGCILFYVCSFGVEPWSSVKNEMLIGGKMEAGVSFFNDVKGKAE